jgi:hypothetical protein
MTIRKRMRETKKRERRSRSEGRKKIKDEIKEEQRA